MFRAIGVSPLNPRAMDDKTISNSLYIAREDNNRLNENIGNSNDVANDSP